MKSRNAELPTEIAAIIQHLLALLDQYRPGGIEGLYLVGSAALNDYRPGLSDIDFIAVAALETDLSPLPLIHAALAKDHPHVNCDGIYLTRGELACLPGGVGPAAREGIVTSASPDERHPLTWLTLLRHGVTMRGQVPDPGWITADASAAIDYSRRNLDTYWRPWLDRLRTQDGNETPTLAWDWATMWGALGIARLHAMITTGQVLSKSGAGHHALSVFPQHAPIIQEALRLREGRSMSAYRSPFARSRDLIAFMEAVIEGAEPVESGATRPIRRGLRVRSS